MTETPGQVLRAARLRLGVSGREAARRAGVSQQYLWDLEHDRRPGAGPGAERMCKSLKVSVTEFRRAVLRRQAVELQEAAQECLREAERPRPRRISIQYAHRTAW